MVEYFNKGQTIDNRVIKISMESLGNVCRSITNRKFRSLKVASAMSCLSIKGMNFEDWICSKDHRA